MLTAIISSPNVIFAAFSLLLTFFLQTLFHFCNDLFTLRFWSLVGLVFKNEIN